MLSAHDFGEGAQITDHQRCRVTGDGGSSIASYCVVAEAGTWERCEVPDRDPPNVDTVPGIVGDRNTAANMEIGALFYADTGTVIIADGSETLKLHRRIFGGVDPAAGNWR